MARRRQPEPTANPARGALLVVVAVVIGLFLLRNGLDTSEAITSNSGGNRPTTDGGDPSGDGGNGDGGTDGTTTTTTPPSGRTPAEVPTIVLNDSGVPGAAGKYSDALAALGYQLTNPAGDNAEDPNAETTVIYFAPGFDAEAAAVAVAVGAPDAVPEPLPTAPPGPIADASVVVVIGSDLANVAPPAATTDTTAAAAN